MKLDNRLQSIADFIRTSKKILDVGTDHGYLCLYLVKNKIAEKGIASDLSKGSLSKAIKLIKKEGMQESIECRLGSGLKVAKEEDNIDTIVIAGMGGVLISEILEEDINFIVKTKPKLILQPVQKPELLREYLINNLYAIQEENLVKSDGKIYNIIVARFTGVKDEDYDSKYFEVGKYSDNKSSAYAEQIEFLINKYENIIVSMGKAEELKPKVIKSMESYVAFLKELKRNAIKRN